MGNQNYDYDEEDIVTLTLDNDEEVECSVITIYEVNGTEYIVLLPFTETDEAEEGDVFIYRYKETEDGEPVLENIEDEQEFNLAAAAFDDWLDEQEFEDVEE